MIGDISVSFVYKWTGPDNHVISGETDGTLIISGVGINNAGQYICTSTASYTGSEVDSKYVMDSMNKTSVYLAVRGKFNWIITHKINYNYNYTPCSILIYL